MSSKLAVADFVSGGGPALVAALITTRTISSSTNAGDQDADAARTLNATAIVLLKTLFLDSTILKQVLLTGGSGAEMGTEKDRAGVHTASIPIYHPGIIPLNQI